MRTTVSSPPLVEKLCVYDTSVIRSFSRPELFIASNSDSNTPAATLPPALISVEIYAPADTENDSELPLDVVWLLP